MSIVCISLCSIGGIPAARSRLVLLFANTSICQKRWHFQSQVDELMRRSYLFLFLNSPSSHHIYFVLSTLSFPVYSRPWVFDEDNNRETGSTRNAQDTSPPAVQSALTPRGKLPSHARDSPPEQPGSKRPDCNDSDVLHDDPQSEWIQAEARRQRKDLEARVNSRRQSGQTG